MSQASEKLPYGVGRSSAAFLAFVAVVLGVAILGIRAYAHELSAGPGSSGMRNISSSGGAAWGLYIVCDGFFIGLSFPGIALAALTRIFRVRALEPIVRIALLLSVVSLMLAGMVVVADLGRPLEGLLYLPKFARPMSPFYGTFTLVVSAYFFASFVFLYLTGRRDAALCGKIPSRLRWFHLFWAAGYSDTPGERKRSRHVLYWLSLLLIPLVIIGHSTLGYIFGIQVGRPGWFGSLQAPNFVVLAGVSGIGLLLVIVPLVRRLQGLHETVDEHAYRWLGNILWILSAVHLYFMLSEWLTTSYAGREAERLVEHSIMFGQYQPLFIITGVSLGFAFLLPFIAYVSRRWSLWLLVPAGIAANVGVFLKRYLLVVPSQTNGSMLGDPPGHYIPSSGEIMVGLGLTAIGILVFAGFMKVFPIVPIRSDDSRADDLQGATVGVKPVPADPARVRRLSLFLLTLLSGLGAASYGFFSSPTITPREGTPFAPVIFVIGVSLMFLSAVVYELVPAGENKPNES